MQALQSFGQSAVVLKDYVKSRKHEWLQACFIPNASQREIVEPIVNKFLELQGDNLNVGLVFREWIELQSIGAHAKSANAIEPRISSLLSRWQTVAQRTLLGRRFRGAIAAGRTYFPTLRVTCKTASSRWMWRKKAMANG